MNGKPVELERRAVASVMVKHSVITTMYPKTAFRPTPHNIAFGRVFEASLISSAIDGQYSEWFMGSAMDQRYDMTDRLKRCLVKEGEVEESLGLHMCTEQSNPIIELNAVSSPIIYAVPIVGQFPPLLNCVNATLAEFLGARTQSGITIAKRPIT